ncbi:MAG: four helix bundle protein [Bacteroidales bacterium]|nr:four helix bundle protein [Bacteroidales bacterium]
MIQLTFQINMLCWTLNGSVMAKYITDQMIRSSTSAALNYAEALGAESRKDFLHKIKIVLKELRETEVALRIVHRNNLTRSKDSVKQCIQENTELIAIFWKTAETAQKNLPSSPKS